ncbi:MAG: hypothetical protein U5P41_15480 [Gammaproteobacteria bacterium]|nr:hypothetical protein [Gammaproteobacteria bacterium]
MSPALSLPALVLKAKEIQGDIFYWMLVLAYNMPAHAFASMTVKISHRVRKAHGHGTA